MAAKDIRILEGNSLFKNFEVVTAYQDGTVLTPENEANYLGALYNKTDVGDYAFLGKPRVFALSSISPTIANFKKLLRDYVNTEFLLIIDTVLNNDTSAVVIVPASVTVLFTGTGELTGYYTLNIQGRVLNSYKSLTDKPTFPVQIKPGLSATYNNYLYLPLSTFLEPYHSGVGATFQDNEPTKTIGFGLFHQDDIVQVNGMKVTLMPNPLGYGIPKIEWIMASVGQTVSKARMSLVPVSQDEWYLGVGTDFTPQERLHLDGNVKAKSFILETGSYITSTNGLPEGRVYGKKGDECIDATTGIKYYKTTSASMTGWKTLVELIAATPILAVTSVVVASYADMQAIPVGKQKIDVLVLSDENLPPDAEDQPQQNTRYEIWPAVGGKLVLFIPSSPG